MCVRSLTYANSNINIGSERWHWTGLYCISRSCDTDEWSKSIFSIVLSNAYYSCPWVNLRRIRNSYFGRLRSIYHLAPI